MIVKRKIKFAALIASAVFISGCLRLPSSNQVKLMNDYGGSQARIDAELKTQTGRFRHVREDVKNNFLKPGFSKEQMLGRYGEPVVFLKNTDSGDIEETWLYRDPLTYSNTDRVYLYFGRDSRLLSWEYKPAETPDKK